MTKIDDAAMTAADRIVVTELIVDRSRDHAAAGATRSASRSRASCATRSSSRSALVMLYPVIWMVVSSLRPNDVIFREPGLILDSFEISNYVDGWNALTYPFNCYL